MRRIASSLVALALATCLAATGCASAQDYGGEEGASAQKATDEASAIPAGAGEARVLEDVVKVHTVENDDELTIRLFEIATPAAFNGTKLSLAVEDKLWELPDGVAADVKVESLGRGKVRITAQRQSQEQMEPSAWQAVVSFGFDDAAVDPTLNVEANGAVTTRVAKTDAASKFLSKVSVITAASAQGMDVRVVEVDASSNFGEVYLVVSSDEASVFDLGVRASSVRGLKVDRDAQTITISGAGYEDRDGVPSNPTFVKTYALSVVDGVPSSVRLVR